MKNSASNRSETPTITQALREKAGQLLPVLTATLSTLKYKVISHQRISQQNNDNITGYQGLTCAQHPQFGSVIIKWALSPNTNLGAFSQNEFNNNVCNYSPFNLNHEVAVLHDLKQSQPIKRQNNSALTLAIAPPVLAYDTLEINILGQNQQCNMLVMPYYPMGDLAHQLNHNRHYLLDNEQKKQYITQAAYLIGNLHNSSWLHNDIKPSNILLAGFLANKADYSSITPRLLLTDFALAERFGENFNGYFDLKGATNTAGTPAYLAPERWQAEGATQQSDIYAFGIMVYEILIGTRPFKIVAQNNDPLKEWATQHCQKPIPVLPQEYRHYQHVINNALAKRIEKRYKTMKEVLSNLEAF